MKWSVILMVATTFAASASASTIHPEPWRIIRYDYKEFCAGTTLTWDLRNRTLKTVQGACDPDGKAPPTISLKAIRPETLKRLRALSRQAFDDGIALQPCNSVPIHVLSGPVSFSVEIGSRKISSPNCINALGRGLETAMAESIQEK